MCWGQPLSVCLLVSVSRVMSWLGGHQLVQLHLGMLDLQEVTCPPHSPPDSLALISVSSSQQMCSPPTHTWTQHYWHHLELSLNIICLLFSHRLRAGSWQLWLRCLGESCWWFVLSLSNESPSWLILQPCYRRRRFILMNWTLFWQCHSRYSCVFREGF